MPKDFIIEHIRNGNTLEYEKIEKKGYTWVSEGMESEIKDWFPTPVSLPKSLSTRFQMVMAMQGKGAPPPPEPRPLPPSPPVLIHAPTGSGKNWFVMNTLGNIAKRKGQKILVLTNRKALCKQQRVEADRKNGLPLFGDKVYEDYPNSEHILILSYQEVIPYLEKNPMESLWTIKSVIFDEAHFFFSDSVFNRNTALILRTLLNYFFSCKRIYMSATPNEVKPLLALEELRIYSLMAYKFDIDSDIRYGTQEVQRLKSLGEFPRIKEFVFSPTFEHTHLHFFHVWSSVKSAIKSELEEETSSLSKSPPTKWLIFRQSKDEGRELKKELGSCADFVSAEEKKDNNQKLQRIVERKKFDAKVLISTTVLYNGVSIEDGHLKHIVVDSLNRAEVIQMLGRKRIHDKDVVNLYIKVPTVSEIEDHVNFLGNRFSSTQSFVENPTRFIKEKWELEELPNSTRKLFGPQQGKFGKTFGMSEYAPYQLTIEEGQYKDFLNSYDEYDEFTVEKKICEEWFSQIFSEEMYLGETRSQQRERIAKEVFTCAVQFMKRSPFPVSVCEDLWSTLKGAIEPVRGEMKLYLKHRFVQLTEEEQQERDNEAKFGSLLADINNILGCFHISYEVKKNNKLCVLQQITKPQ